MQEMFGSQINVAFHPADYMSIDVRRLDGTIVTISNADWSIELAIDLYGYVEVKDMGSGELLRLERDTDGTVIEVRLSLLH